MTRYRNTWVNINLDHLAYNIDIIKTASKKSIFAVIKANAYGHGDIEIAKFLESLPVSYLCVSSLDEATHLRNHAIKAPIIVLGYTEPEHLPEANEMKITTVIPSLEWLKKALICSDSLSDQVFHIKIDSGMNRVGIKSIQEYKDVLSLANDNNLNIEGLYTHLSSSNYTDSEITKQQMEVFQQFINSSDRQFKWVHTANSDAALTLGNRDFHSNAVRCGIAMYGYSTFEKKLQPVLSLYCGINQIKKLVIGDQVSYSATYTAKEEEAIAVLPIGYADGLSRRLQGYNFSIKGVPCEVIGRVCMDLIMIRVPTDTTIEDTVEIIGKYGDASRMADYIETISYEILTSINPRITRRYIKDGRILKTQNERFD